MTVNEVADMVVSLSMAIGVGLYFGRKYGPKRVVTVKEKPTSCSQCSSRSDPRCAAANCTYHCACILGCNGRCLNAWERSDAAGDLAREAMRKARVDG